MDTKILLPSNHQSLNLSSGRKMCQISISRSHCFHGYNPGEDEEHIECEFSRDLVKDGRCPQPIVYMVWKIVRCRRCRVLDRQIEASSSGAGTAPIGLDPQTGVDTSQPADPERETDDEADEHNDDPDDGVDSCLPTYNESEKVNLENGNLQPSSPSPQQPLPEYYMADLVVPEGSEEILPPYSDEYTNLDFPDHQQFIWADRAFDSGDDSLAYWSAIRHFRSVLDAFRRTQGLAIAIQKDHLNPRCSLFDLIHEWRLKHCEQVQQLSTRAGIAQIVLMCLDRERKSPNPDERKISRWQQRLKDIHRFGWSGDYNSDVWVERAVGQYNVLIDLEEAHLNAIQPRSPDANAG